MSQVKAYLQITLDIPDESHPAVAKVYNDYHKPFLDTIEGSVSKNLLIRTEDVQVLHGFDSVEHAQNYLQSDMFKNDVLVGLQPLWKQDSDIRIYSL